MASWTAEYVTFQVLIASSQLSLRFSLFAAAVRAPECRLQGAIVFLGGHFNSNGNRFQQYSVFDRGRQSGPSE